MFTSFKDMVLSMRKSKDPLASVMVFHLSEIKQIGKKENREPTSDDTVQYVKRAVAKLKQDNFANPVEIEVLSTYLPKMATEQELLTVITAAIAAGGSIGEVMKEVKTKFGATADMALVRALYQAQK